MSGPPPAREWLFNPTYLALPAWIVLCLLAGAAGSVVSGPGEWYQSLDKPTWTPPSWLFGPVWTILYVMMGVAAWLVSKRYTAPGRTTALALFMLQLSLNAVWSFIFFGAQRIGLALADIVLLWMSLAATIAAFWMVRPLAAMLLIPYLGWVSFATALTAAIWVRNSG